MPTSRAAAPTTVTAASGALDVAAPPPLVVSADPVLLEELVRLSAAAGVTPEVAREMSGALRCWAVAPVVLVGADVAAELARVRPERRPHVHVLSVGAVGDDLYREALQLGAESVAVLPASETWLVETLTDLTDVTGSAGLVGADAVRGRAGGVLIGVLGGSGGAGATTLACALGQVAARSAPALVVDCDPQGPGVDHVLGLDAAPGAGWEALGRTTGRLSARALRESLPRSGQLAVLTWRPRTGASLQAFAVREALSAGRRGHGVVVVDLPRTPDPLVAEVTARCDRLVLVVRPTVTGVASAIRTGSRFADHPEVGVVVRGTGLPPVEVAAAVGLPLLAEMGDQRRLAELVDLGLGPAPTGRRPLARTAAGLLAAAGAGAA